MPEKGEKHTWFHICDQQRVYRREVWMKKKAFADLSWLSRADLGLIYASHSYFGMETIQVAAPTSKCKDWRDRALSFICYCFRGQKMKSSALLQSKKQISLPQVSNLNNFYGED